MKDIHIAQHELHAVFACCTLCAAGIRHQQKIQLKVLHGIWPLYRTATHAVPCSSLYYHAQAYMTQDASAF